MDSFRGTNNNVLVCGLPLRNLLCRCSYHSLMTFSCDGVAKTIRKGNQPKTTRAVNLYTTHEYMLKTFLIGIWLIIYHVMCSDKEWNGYPVYSYNSSMPLVH